MKKVCLDMGSLMPQMANFEDRGCLSYMAHLMEKTNISNNPKEIKKNDDSFERHDQFLAAVASQALGNMWENWVLARPSVVGEVRDKQSAVDIVLQMLHHFGVIDRLTFDPERVEEVELPEDDLFSYYREAVVRFLISLALDVCEEEGDAVGLLALERLMVPYFLGSNLKSQNVKYADFTIFDVVKVLSSSPRTRQRMAESSVVNVSGTSGGGLFWDKVNEHVVRMVKGCLKRQHGNALDDILVEKDVGAMSVLATIARHNEQSLLRGRIGKEHSHDYVGDSARGILAQQMTKLDPFNRSSRGQVTFRMKVRGDPYKGLKKTEVERFMKRKQGEWEYRRR